MRKSGFARVLMLSLSLIICASVGWSAIGVYKWSATATVPSAISYTLNTNADDTADGWSVKIEILPASGGTAVRTISYLWDPNDTNSMCARGEHTTYWDGKQDNGTGAPASNYIVRITAKAAPVTGTDLVPLWESDISSTKWVDAAINTNVNSSYYGYIYAVNYSTHHVHMWEPDGTYVGTLPDTGVDWGGSGPWSVDVAGDDKVYASSYSRYTVVEFSADGTSHGSPITIQSWRNPRCIAVTGSGSSFKIVATRWTSTAVPPDTAAGIYTQTGQPPASPFNEHLLALRNYMQPEFDSDGYINIPAFSDAGSTSGGSILKFDMDGNVIAENSNIRHATGLTLTPDGQYFWVSRFVNTTLTDTDTTAIYRVQADKMYDTADLADPYAIPAKYVDKFGIANSGTNKRAYTLKADVVGNLCAAAGNSGGLTSNADCANIGLYAPPDNGSTDTRETSAINWTGDYQPSFDSANDGVEASACDSNKTANVQVVASDLNGYTDIQAVYLDLSPFNGSDHTAMTRISGSGNISTWQKVVSVPSGTKVGDYNLNVYLRDTHYPTVLESSGKVLVKVTGGWITGKVVNSVSGRAIAGATVTATDNASNSFTAITDVDGTYTISASPGDYTVTAHKDSHNDSTDTAPSATVACSATTSIADLTLDPKSIYDVTQGNDRYTCPVSGTEACVMGTVQRTHASDNQKGFDGYYYIYDTSNTNTYTGLKVMVYTGQADLKAGDIVVVDGTWTVPYAINQGQIVPSAEPYVVSTGNPLGSEDKFWYSIKWHSAYGRFYKASGKVNYVGTNYFAMDVPTDESGASTTSFGVYVPTFTTVGALQPSVGDLVDVYGFLSMLVQFGENCLVVGGENDISIWHTVKSIGAAKALPNGGVIIDLTGETDQQLVVTYVDPGESADGIPGKWFWVEDINRTQGLKVNTGTDQVYLPAMLVGDTIQKLAGTLVTPSNSGRELILSETPEYILGAGVIVPYLSMNMKSFGGGQFGGTSLQTDGTPKVLDGAGLSTDGLLVRITGLVTGAGSDDPTSTNAWKEWIYVDDGSGVRSDNGMTGIKVIKAFNPADPYVDGFFYNCVGKHVIIQGISTSEYISDVGRIRELHMIYDGVGYFTLPIQVLD